MNSRFAKDLAFVATLAIFIAIFFPRAIRAVGQYLEAQTENKKALERLNLYLDERVKGCERDELKK